MKNWGYKILQPRALDFDVIDLETYNRLLEKVPSARRCLMCGACTATCSANLHIDFNLRKTHLLFSRGQFDGLANELDKCMLCGKCKLVCPRGVNTRALINNMRIVLNDMNYKSIKL